MLKFCPECGSKLVGNKFCSNCGADLAKYTVDDSEVGSDSALNSAIDSLMELSKERQEADDRLRSYIVRGLYDKAKKFCEEIIEKDPLDKRGHIGLIRTVSKNYTDYEGREICEAIRVAEEMLGKDVLLADNEYAEYIVARNKYIQEKPLTKTECLAAIPKFEPKIVATRLRYIEKLNSIQTTALVEYMKKSCKEDTVITSCLMRGLFHFYHKQTIESIYSSFQVIKYYNEKPSTAIQNKFISFMEQQFGDDYINDLGCNYYKELDYAQAVVWFKRAAEQGSRAAQYNLGWSYANGEGVPKDITKAVYWYKKAAAQGDTDAAEALKKLGK